MARKLAVHGLGPRVRQLRRRRQHLNVDTRPVHQPQPRIQFRAGPGADPALRGGVGSAEVHQHVEVGVGPVVSVHVDPHARNGSTQPIASG